MPLPCKHALHVGPLRDGKWRRVYCTIVNKLVGHGCGIVDLDCGRCHYDKGDTTVVEHLAKSHIKTRLISGDLPRWASPIDLIEKFGRFMARSTEAEQVDLITRMYRFQSVIAPDDGGLAPDGLAQKLAAVAERYDNERHHLSNALEDAAIATLKAAQRRRM